MIIDKRELKEKKELDICEETIIKEEDIKNCVDIISINKVDSKLHVQYISGLAICKLEVKADLVLRSTRTLNPVPYKIKDKEEYTLCFEEQEYELDEDIIQVNESEYDFYKDILSLIITNIPLKIIGKNEPDHIEGNNWEVISEEEYEKRKKENIDPRLEAFANIDIDE